MRILQLLILVLLCLLPIALRAHGFHQLRVDIVEGQDSLEWRVTVPFTDLLNYVDIDANTLIDADHDENWNDILKNKARIANWLKQSLKLGEPAEEMNFKDITLKAVNTEHNEYIIIDQIIIEFSLQKNEISKDIILSQHFNDEMMAKRIESNVNFTGLDGVLRPFILTNDKKLRFSLVEPPSTWVSIYQFVSKGFSHILNLNVLSGEERGDHLAFLLALILIYRKVKPLLIATSIFTLAHCITLLLSGLNLMTLSPTIVEPLIALTVAFSGYHAWKLNGDESRGKLAYLMIFVYGLIHGLGFSFQARQMFDPSTDIFLWLFSFNLGIELGQISFLLLLFGLMQVLNRSPELYRKISRSLSALLLFLGTYWFVATLVVGVK